MIKRRDTAITVALLTATFLVLASCGSSAISSGGTGSANTAPVVDTSDVTAASSSLEEVVLVISTIF